MKRLKHPHFKDFYINVEDEHVAAHVAAGWLEPKSRKRKSDKDQAAESNDSAEESPSTGDGEA